MQQEAQRVRPCDAVNQRVAECGCVPPGRGEAPTMDKWTTWQNLFNWFENFKTFLVEFDFAGVDDDGELTFTEEQVRRIKNIDETELALDGSTHTGSRPAVSFYNPHLPIASRSVAKIFTCSRRSSYAGSKISTRRNLLWTAARTQAAGPQCHFTIPTFQLQAGLWQTLHLPARGYLEATLPASVCLRTSSYQQAQRPRRGRRFTTSF